MDVSQYLEIFIDESAEHLQTLSDCIMELEKEPDNKDVIKPLLPPFWAASAPSRVQ